MLYFREGIELHLTDSLGKMPDFPHSTLWEKEGGKAFGLIDTLGQVPYFSTEALNKAYHSLDNSVIWCWDQLHFVVVCAWCRLDFNSQI